jgi:hypothetical protein
MKSKKAAGIELQPRPAHAAPLSVLDFPRVNIFGAPRMGLETVLYSKSNRHASRNGTMVTTE